MNRCMESLCNAAGLCLIDFFSIPEPCMIYYHMEVSLEKYPSERLQVADAISCFYFALGTNVTSSMVAEFSSLIVSSFDLKSNPYSELTDQAYVLRADYRGTGSEV